MELDLGYGLDAPESTETQENFTDDDTPIAEDSVLGSILDAQNAKPVSGKEDNDVVIRKLFTVVELVFYPNGAVYTRNPKTWFQDKKYYQKKKKKAALPDEVEVTDAEVY